MDVLVAAQHPEVESLDPVDRSLGAEPRVEGEWIVDDGGIERVMSEHRLSP